MSDLEKPIKRQKPQITVTVAQETYDQLERLAEQTHLGRTYHVQSALNDYLAKHLPQTDRKS